MILSRTCCIIVLLPIAALSVEAGTKAPRFVQADVYFMSWETMTRSAQRPAEVRSHPDVVVRGVEGECLKGLIGALRLDELKPSRKGGGDARLVIDFRDASGKLVTYYADSFRLMSEDASSSRQIDEGFKYLVGSSLFRGKEAWCTPLTRPADI
jgi:hypothetical protein